MREYKRLFESWKLKNFIIRNRICVPPLVIYNWGDRTGKVSEKSIRHYEALTGGGAGLVIQEATSVCPEGRLTGTMLGIWEDGQIEGLKRLAEVFHRADMPAIVQLSHAGILAEGRENQVAPSAYHCVGNGEERDARELKAQELRILEQKFIDGAERAFRAGYDGIELHASHGYLLSELLNKRLNRRTDAYNAEDRLFFRNILSGIREVTSGRFIIGVRLGAFEPGIEDGISIARWFEQEGVDFIDSFIGCDWEMDMEKPQGYPFHASEYGAKRIKEAVSVPVFAVYGISSGEQAEAVLEDTGADMAVVGRGSLVNYNWGNDVREGQNPGKCRNCTLCMWKVDSEKCPGRLELYRQKKK